MSLSLSHGSALLELELLGAVVKRLEIEGRPLLHPARGDVRQDPTLGACFPMVPWCNRLSKGGIATREGMIPRDTNWSTTVFPVHGHGWQETWHLADRSRDHVHLRVRREEPAGYSYIAELKITLHDDGATFVFCVTNTGPQTLPFGLGLHPYISCDRSTLLTVPADRMVPIDADGLPLLERHVSGHLDFMAARPVGLEALSVFYPNSQVAMVTTGDQVIHLKCGGALRHLMIWKPENQPFLCIEPMSHGVDHFSDHCTAALHELEQHETLTGWLKISFQLTSLD